MFLGITEPDVKDCTIFLKDEMRLAFGRNTLNKSIKLKLYFTNSGVVAGKLMFNIEGKVSTKT